MGMSRIKVNGEVGDGDECLVLYKLCKHTL